MSTCKTCKHWRPNTGECVRFPPTLPARGPMSPANQHPKTTADMGCGEHAVVAKERADKK